MLFVIALGMTIYGIGQAINYYDNGYYYTEDNSNFNWNLENAYTAIGGLGALIIFGEFGYVFYRFKEDQKEALHAREIKEKIEIAEEIDKRREARRRKNQTQ